MIDDMVLAYPPHLVWLIVAWLVLGAINPRAAFFVAGLVIGLCAVMS